MNKKERQETRKWFKKILRHVKTDYIPEARELLGVLRNRPQGIEGEDWDFIEFILELGVNPCLHNECKGKDVCLMNPLERRYRRFIEQFGAFTKYEFLCLRLALKI